MSPAYATFTMRWLIPRLPQLAQAHPDIVVHIDTQTRPFLFSDTAFDAANILLAGIKDGATDRVKMLEFVKGYEGDGVAASYKFAENGELAPDQVKVWAYKVEKGQVVPDQEIK